MAGVVSKLPAHLQLRVLSMLDDKVQCKSGVRLPQHSNAFLSFVKCSRSCSVQLLSPLTHLSSQNFAAATGIGSTDDAESAGSDRTYVQVLFVSARPLNFQHFSFSMCPICNFEE